MPDQDQVSNEQEVEGSGPEREQLIKVLEKALSSLNLLDSELVQWSPEDLFKPPRKQRRDTLF